MNISCETFSEVGMCRKDNQDRVFSYIGDEFSLFVIADGMGGHSAGGYAGDVVIKHAEIIQYMLMRFHGDIQGAVDIAVSEISAANTELFRYGQKNGIICGSTVSMLIILDNVFAVINAGDSPVYFADRNMFIHASTEHLYAEMEKKSTLIFVPDDDERSGRLTKAVGAAENIYPSVRTDRICGRQAFLMCSDGVSRYNDEASVSRLLKDTARGRLTVKNALEKLRQNAYSSGAQDNLSAAVILAEKSDGAFRLSRLLFAVLCVLASVAVITAAVMALILRG